MTQHLTVPDTFLTLLKAETVAAEAAEGEFRRSYYEQLQALERARSFAHRRLHFAEKLTAAIDGAEDDAQAIAAGARLLAEEFGLEAANPAHQPVFEAFRAVSDAVDTVLNCEGEPNPALVRDALKTFETWYETRSGQPLFALYDVYVQQTPVVDF
jgi:hypothetical protein